MDVVVLGSGGVGRADLAAGVCVARELADRVPEDVRILAGSTAPTVESELDGATHILLIDCVDVGRAPGSVVLFDGECNLCSAAVWFVLRRDGRARSRFAARQSAAARQLLLAAGFAGQLPDSLVLVDGDQPRD